MKMVEQINLRKNMEFNNIFLRGAIVASFFYIQTEIFSYILLTYFDTKYKIKNKENEFI